MFSNDLLLLKVESGSSKSSQACVPNSSKSNGILILIAHGAVSYREPLTSRPLVILQLPICDLPVIPTLHGNCVHFKLPSVDRVFLKIEFLLFLNNFISLCICLFLAVLGLHCCVGFSLVVASRGYSVAVMFELLTEVTSLAVEDRLNICGARA